MTPEARLFFEARSVIEDVPSDGMKHIAGGMQIVGRPVATSVMRALDEAGLKIVRKGEEDVTTMEVVAGADAIRQAIDEHTGMSFSHLALCLSRAALTAAARIRGLRGGDGSLWPPSFWGRARVR